MNLEIDQVIATAAHLQSSKTLLLKMKVCEVRQYKHLEPHGLPEFIGQQRRNHNRSTSVDMMDGE